jgi:hypothetical protein
MVMLAAATRFIVAVAFSWKRTVEVGVLFVGAPNKDKSKVRAVVQVSLYWSGGLQT